MNIFELLNGKVDEDDNKKSELDNKYYVNSVTFNSDKNNLHDIIKKDLENQYSVDSRIADKYRKYGIQWNPRDAANGLLDVQLAKNQSNWEKLGNALKQGLVSEVGYGAVKSVADLFDLLTGAIFKSDNDYQNPVSSYFENLQEQYRESHPIYTDPTKIGWQDWNDFGWWMSNIPSIANSLTLLIPGRAVGKGVSVITKALGKGLKKTVAFSRKTLKSAKITDEATRLGRISKFENFINRPDVGKYSDLLINGAATGTTMHLLENYQEGRQVYNDMMTTIIDSMKDMSPEEREKLINRNKELLESKGINTDDDTEVAKAIAKEAADRTFKIDMINLGFDVFQALTIGNPLKLPKSLRATYKVNKAQRESKIIATLGDVKGAEAIAGRTFKQKTKDFVSDLGKSKWLITSELSEGVEEAVNYIAQQEGMNYGTLMFKPEDANLDNADRFRSYFANSELYESAFWGVVGGVVFQAGATGINRLSNATINTIHKNKHANDKTHEREKTTWKQEYENTENRTRTAEINKRYANLQRLKEQRERIFEMEESPFEDDVLENGTQRKLTTQLEKDAAWSRAVDEYITIQTFLAMDAGNFNLFKAYLQDKNVRKVVEELVNTDKSNNAKVDVDQLVKRMDEIEQKYTNHLILVNAFAGQLNGDEEEEVPLEYVNIIARDNTLSEIKAERLQHKIDDYEQSATANAFRFKQSLKDGFGNPTLDYKTTVSLVTAINYLRELRAKKQAILNDPKRAGSIEGQQMLNSINSKIDVLNNYIANLKPALTSIKTDERLYSVINTLFATHQSLDGDSSEYQDFVKALATKDIATLSKITGRDFELTDDDIVKVFGENADGVFYNLSEEVLTHFGIDKAAKQTVSKFEELAPNLKDDYDVISALEISKLFETSKISNTVKSVHNRIGELNNTMNAARVAAINESRNILIKTAKKYGRKEMIDYIFNNTPISNITDEDKNAITDALTVLNLTNPINENLSNMIVASILIGDYENTIVNENSSTSENPISDDNKSNETKSSQPQQNSPKSSENGSNDNSQVKQNAPQAQQTESPRVRINSDIDSGVSIDFTSDTTEDTIPTKESQQGYELLVTDNTVTNEERYKAVSNSALFEGYDKNNKGRYRITANPIINKTEDGKSYVAVKGKIEYEKPKNEPETKPTTTITQSQQQQSTTQSQQQHLPTGEEEQSFQPEPLTEEEAEEEARKLAEVEKQLSFIRTSFKRLLSIAQSMKQNNKSDSEILDAIKSEINNIKSEEGYSEDYNDVLDRNIELISKRFNLMSLVDKINDVKSSTVIEKSTGKYSQEFINSVYELLDEYIKIANARKGDNNKYYINFESFIRNLNAIYPGYYEGEAIYKKLKEFLTSEYNQKVILVDNVNDPNILENARKTVETRLKERIGQLDKYRVGIEELFKRNDASFLQAFNALKVGDKLELDYDDTRNRLVVRHKGVVVGILGAPKRTITNDGYEVTNRGWITDVYEDVNRSKLRAVLKVLSNTDAVNDIIFKILYDKTNNSQKNDLKIKVYDIILPYANAVLDTEHIVTDADKQNAVDFICNIWRYKATENDFTQYGQSVGVYIDSFIDKFFTKLYNTYDTVYSFRSKNLDSIVVEVANINDGELIRVVDESKIDLKSSRKSRNNYSEFTQSNSALSNPDECEVGVVKENGTLTLAANKSIDHAELGSKGTVHLVIPNRSGKDQFCIATSVQVSDTNLDKTSDAYKIIKEANEYLNSAIDNYIKNKDSQSFDILVTVINQMFGGNGVVGLFGGVKNTTLRDVIGLRIGEYSIIIDKNKANFTSNFDNASKPHTASIESASEELKNTINTIFNSTFFNVDFSFFDSTNAINNGFIGYSNDGKSFIIRINKKDYKYDNPSQAFIKGGLLRVNTKIEDGSNYSRIGKNQAGNAILEVSFANKPTSPVEKNETEPSTDTTTKDKTTDDIINNNDAEDVVDEVLSIALPNMAEADKKELKKLGLLPKRIKFVENLTDNDGNEAIAQIVNGADHISITRLWANMFDGVGEYSEDKDFYRKQAIRKLIHEQIHAKLAESDKETILAQVKQIYDEFENYCNTLSKEEQKIYLPYLFKNKANVAERIEDFIVESFTSIALAEKLNSITANYDNIEIDKDKKETLWTKIIKIIANLFGYDFAYIDKAGRNSVNINEQGLLQKELYALAGALNTKGETKIDNNLKPKGDELKPKGDDKKDDLDELDDDVDLKGPSDKHDSAFSTVIESPIKPNNKNDMFEQEIEELKNNAIKTGDIVLKTDGSFDYAKAPNGKRSNLDERDWLRVRTKAFKNEFGDWLSNLRYNSIYKDKTPIKDKYKGKLIFAQSGTGKSAIADNINVIDSDFILGKLLGVGPSNAFYALSLLSYENKSVVLEEYKQSILDLVKAGKTVLTSSPSLMDYTDIIIYNSSVTQTNIRTNNEERRNTNKFINTEYVKDIFDAIVKHKEKNPNKEYISLNENEYLSDIILTNNKFKANKTKISNLNDDAKIFLNNFGITINELDNYDGELPLFDALNKCINIRSVEDISDAVGYAIAFMMQHDDTFRDVVAFGNSAANGVKGISRKSNAILYKPTKKGYDAKKAELGTSNNIKAVGQEISKELRKLYNLEPIDEKETGLIAAIRRLIDLFFSIISDPILRNRLHSAVNFAKDAANAVAENDKDFIIRDYVKPGKKEIAYRVDLEKALSEFKYEESIIELMTKHDIALTGSAAIAVQASIYRPIENPLHDLDFNAANLTKDKLESILNKNFKAVKQTNTISNEDGETYTYLVLDRAFEEKCVGKDKKHRNIYEIYDVNNNKIGTRIDSDLILAEGIEGKMLDFFMAPTKYPPIRMILNNKEFLISDYKNALSKKIEWHRDKDIWDYNRLIDNNFNKEFVSTAVDENGEPVPVYHGSPVAFDKFDNSHKRYNIHEGNNYWFVTDKNIAKLYGNNIHKAFLKIKNIGTNKYVGSDTITTLRRKENELLSQTQYDGFRLDTIDKGGKQTQYAVKNSDQIIIVETENNTYSSTIIESAPKHTSITPFVLSFNPELQSDIAKQINNGDLSYKCN